jgi:hypothetical protein
MHKSNPVLSKLQGMLQQEGEFKISISDKGESKHIVLLHMSELNQ